ncbi:MAG: threonylcarbamoyl-AMP synthase [Nitrospinae bacterium]|nr:threonylcarbamoyl-AMP synthase [Nitrospinota bacterium]
MSKTIKVDLGNKESWVECLDEVSAAVKRGWVLVFPTETFYALGCNGLDASPVKNIYELKARPSMKPLLLLISGPEELPSLVKEIPDPGKKLMEAFWPGPLTLIFKASALAPALVTGGTGKIGIRVPGLQFTREMIKTAGAPLIGTSANVSGKPDASNIKDAISDFGEGVGLYLDAGTLEGGAPSTVVDVSGGRPLLVREGRITKAMIEKY